MSTGSKIHTHYDNLKVARNAPDSVIRAAYRALSQQYHPDKHGGDSTAANIMRIINEAYAELSDPARRQAHDVWIAAQEEAIAKATSRPPPSPPPSTPSPPPRPQQTAVRKESPWWKLGFYGLLFFLFIVAINSGRSGSSSYPPAKPGLGSSDKAAPLGQKPAPIAASPVQPANPKLDPRPAESITFTDLLPRGRVAAPELNVRAGPSTKHDVVAKLRFLDTVAIEGPANNGWIPVSHKAGFGYVNGTYLQLGTDSDTLLTLCSDTTTPPASGTLIKKPDTQGDHELRITSAAGVDALVKLKDRAGRTVLTGYVRRGETYTFQGVPAGSYSAWFATGSNFSARCGRFLQDMSVTYDTVPQDFKTTYAGNVVYSTIVEYSLQRQRGGNFSPSGGDVDTFNLD